MAEHTRKDPRAKVLSMTVRYKSATLDEFIEHHSHDVSRGGMYIKTPQPFPPGTLLKFEVKIAADQRVMQGVGRVVWRRESEEASAEHPAGMGVKFIKLDDESKDIIDQLITARTGDISAFDEVAPETDSSQGALDGSAPASSSNDGFFPKSGDGVQQPAPEDRTVMKQATELLQEALREVGGGSPSDSAMRAAAQDVIPKAPKAAAISPSGKAPRAADVPQPQELTPRYQKIPTPVAAAGRGSGGPASDSAKPTGGGPAARSTFEPSTPQATKQPIISDAPKTVPASPMAARRAAPGAPAGEQQSFAQPAKSSNRGLQIGVALALVGAVAIGAVVLARKPAPPPATEPTPAPSASQKVESAPAVIDVTAAAADAAPAPVPSASAAPSEAPAASAAPSASTTIEKPTAAPAAEPEAPKVPKAAPVKHKKADAGVASPRPLDTADDLYPTPAPTPAKTDTPSSGSPEAPAPTATAKSKAKAATPAPAPTTTEEPAP